MKVLCAAFALALFATAPLPAQSVAGEWDAEIDTPGGPRPFKIVFAVHGDSLSGTVKRPAGEVPLLGSVRGDTVRFAYTIVYNENELTLSVTAKLTGDTMAGTVDFGGAAQEAFRARRSSAPPPGSKP